MTNPVKAIRAYCLDCCRELREEVKYCPSETLCALGPFRMGKNPFRTKRVLTEDQRLAMSERLAKARNKNV
jgi:hypothetical protein